MRVPALQTRFQKRSGVSHATTRPLLASKFIVPAGTHEEFLCCLCDIEPNREAPEMDKRDQELLANKFRCASDPPHDQSAVIGLITVAAFLVGIGIGDILSKSKQANTNYAAMVSRIAETPPRPL